MSMQQTGMLTRTDLSSSSHLSRQESPCQDSRYIASMESQMPAMIGQRWSDKPVWLKRILGSSIPIRSTGMIDSLRRIQSLGRMSCNCVSVHKDYIRLTSVYWAF